MPDVENMAILKILNTSSLFLNLLSAEAEIAAKYFKREIFNADDVVFTDGSYSENVYLVVSGSFEIIRYNSKYQYSKQLRVLKPGEYFSELSVLTKSKHYSSAFALEDATLLQIGASDFFELLKEVPRVSRNLISDLTKLIQDTIDKSDFFRTFNENTATKLDNAMVALMPMKMVQSFEVIPLRLEGNHLVVGITNPLNIKFYNDFRATNPGYEIRTVLMDKTQYGIALAEIRNLHLGNINIVKKPPLSNEVTAASEASVKENELLSLLKNSLLFSFFNDIVIQKLLPHLEYQLLEAHQSLFTPDTDGKNIYIILSGTIRIFKKNKITGGMMPLYKLEAGDCVCDVGIFNNTALTLTARTLTTTQIYTIPRKILDQLLNVTDFTIPLAISLAQTLQKINKSSDGVSIADTIDFRKASELIALFPALILNEHKIIALNKVGMEITVATPQPTSQSMIAALEKALPRYIFKIKFITEENFTQWKTQLAERSKALQQPTHQSTLKPLRNNENIELFKPVGEDVVKTFDLILEKAIENRASDIHIEILESFVVVRYRVDGELIQLWENLSFELGQSIVRKAKLMAELNIAEIRLPQDGQFRFKYQDQEYGMRLSSIPTRHGEKIVLRITGRTSTVIPLRHISPEKNTISFLKRIARHKQGIFLVAGPTGSGKSTTLYSMLNEMNKPGLNIVTIEDPIEVNIAGINQIEIHPDIGLTHEVVLKHVLRQDPDVIFIGEIRDSDSMQLALDASMTGHLVLSTIHANSSLEILPRLKELAGSSTTKVATTLLGVVAQRLVRTLCEQCKVPQPIKDNELERLHHLGSICNSVKEIMNAKGCIHCNFTGFRGQIPLFEYWQKTEELRNLMLDGASTAQLAEMTKALGFETLQEYGLRMVALGLTTFKEVDENIFGTS